MTTYENKFYNNKDQDSNKNVDVYPERRILEEEEIVWLVDNDNPEVKIEVKILRCRKNEAIVKLGFRAPQNFNLVNHYIKV